MSSGYLGSTTGGWEGSAVRPDGACDYCSGAGSWVIHPGVCPKLAEIEYYPNGLVKRVRFREPTP